MDVKTHTNTPSLCQKMGRLFARQAPECASQRPVEGSRGCPYLLAVVGGGTFQLAGVRGKMRVTLAHSPLLR